MSCKVKVIHDPCKQKHVVLQLFQIKALQIAPIMVKKDNLKRKPDGLEKPKAKAKPKAKSFTQALKGKALEKAKALQKAKAQSVPKDSKSSSSKALGKAKAKSFGKGSNAMKVLKKAKLNKANLEKCGSLSLKDKMKMATEEAEDAEEAAALLKKKMTKLESSKVWSKRQTALKAGSEKDKKEFDALSKKEKGLAACQWLLEKEGKQYLSALKQVSVGDKLTREDKWDSELQILQKFSKPELDLHIQSGRVQWRECPTTWGVFEYKDTQNWTRQVSTSRTSGKEYEPEEEDLEKFMELFNNDHHTLEVDDHSLGKGKGPGKGKRKGKGKGKDKGGQGALGEGEEGEEDEDEEKLMKAVRTARNMVSSSKADLEEALEKAKPRLSKSGRNSAALRANELEKALQWLKSTLAGKVKSLTPSDIKAKLKEIAAKIKEARDEKNELKGLAQKALSNAGSKASK